MAGVRTGLLLGAGLMVWLLGPGPLSPYRRALLDRSPPQLVLVLGGDVDRERLGARLARQLDLPLLVSGGSNREYAEWMLSEERFNPDRVTLDYRARDTLSNFTSVVDELQADGVRHVLLVTRKTTCPAPWRWARWWPAAAEFSSPAFPWPAAKTAPRRGASSNGVIGFARWRG